MHFNNTIQCEKNLLKLHLKYAYSLTVYKAASTIPRKATLAKSIQYNFTNGLAVRCNLNRYGFAPINMASLKV